MKTRFIAAASLVALLASGGAFAQSDVSRVDVVGRNTANAWNNGDTNGNREPVSYSNAVSRAEVNAQTRAAMAAGDRFAIGDTWGQQLGQRFQQPEMATAQAKTRDEVRAETLRAMRNDQIVYGDTNS
ncbi:hypothetical protein MW290_28795 [Aquincola tertiaricarbonis]|uniref:DUF4148 domain-containing protein n=1 Tax=Aquincola tertiaricarbonis TaxID=391953 RepID=A0ABY4SBU2_AQUTE|nr:hypothetical protein [Aquincola tertiaricarbonis]URI09557.1 hypothetical protein MW290_28795 [Aquincola tertiaricarbonis]